ncbi:MAG: hypothetical protein NC543_12110 [bacterium]|nr:hypothetical protein [bacterium]MCM1376106.1 hypothetical protein [Muribaculum sp.]
MKRFEITVKGVEEQEIGLEILTAVYAAVQGHGYHDISIQAETVPDRGRPRGFWVPDFMRRQQRLPGDRLPERRR